jgi:hypothetical protein
LGQLGAVRGDYYDVHSWPPTCLVILQADETTWQQPGSLLS